MSTIVMFLLSFIKTSPYRFGDKTLKILGSLLGHSIHYNKNKGQISIPLTLYPIFSTDLIRRSFTGYI